MKLIKIDEEEIDVRMKVNFEKLHNPFCCTKKQEILQNSGE